MQSRRVSSGKDHVAGRVRMYRRGVLLILLVGSGVLEGCSTAPTHGTSTINDWAYEDRAHITVTQHHEGVKKSDDKFALKEFPNLKFSSDSERALHYFSLGQAFSLNNEVESAIESYRTTLVYDPNSALVHSRLAAELVKIGNFSEAKEYCQKAVSLDPKFVDGYLLLAGIQVVSKELDAALNTYERALKIEPKNRDALLYYGTTLAEGGRLEKATVILKKLVLLEADADSQVDPAIAWYYLAKVQTQQDQFEGAAQSLKQSLKVRPGFSKAALFLADIYLAQDKQEKSIKVLEETYHENPNPNVASRLAAFHLSQSHFQKAIPYLETVVENDVDNVSAKVRLALVYWQIEWLDKAYETLYEVYEKFPNSNEVTYYLGELEFERNNPESAISFFAKINPEYARFEEAVARAVASYQLLKRTSEAKDFVEKAIQKKLEVVSFYTILARLNEEEGKITAAIRILENNRNFVEKDETALYYLGYLYDRLGDKKSGKKIMEEILKQDADNANALNYLGYTLLDEGVDIARAESYILKAVELKPNDAYILDSYGWLLFKQGKHQSALTKIEHALELKPNEGVILEHRADVLVELNMKRKALTAYEKALDHLSDPKDQARVNQKIENVAIALGLREEKKPRLPASSIPVSNSN